MFRRKRRPKVRRKQRVLPEEPREALPSANNEDDNNNDNDEGLTLEYEDAVLKRRKVRLSQPQRDYDNNTDSDDGSLPTPEWCEANIAFCCAQCRCPDSVVSESTEIAKGMVYFDDHPYIQTTRDHWPHRVCCHGADKKDKEWSTQFVKAQAKVGDALFSSQILSELPSVVPPLEWVTTQEIRRAYHTAHTQQSALYNADGEATAASLLETHGDYRNAVVAPYDNCCKQRKEKGRPPAVVLDAFAGVGTGIVTLKRLGIAMKKIIHIEHDKVASHVHKYQHDANYNPELQQKDDYPIEHVYEYEAWEDLPHEDLEKFVEKHGPIDIVVGGPPCVDFSRVNAYRQGTRGQHGQYMLEFGRFIRKIERLQSPHPLFFCAENVWLEGKDREEVTGAFGFDWDPIALDALYLSPTRRNRHFLTNLPHHDIDYTADLSHLGPSQCLEEGFVVPAHLVDPEVTAKAQCLMGSKTRIDEPNSLRMYVFQDQTKQKDCDRYLGRPMNVKERELLMGYKEGYVDKAVGALFQELIYNGVGVTCIDQGRWKKKLSKKYHHFSGNYHKLPVANPYRTTVVRDDNNFPQVELLMAPPVVGDTTQPSFFNAQDYAKHLIGMAYSIPVMEHLLAPLQPLFAYQKYEGYDYKYAWESCQDITLDEEDQKPAAAAKKEDAPDEEDQKPAAAIKEEDAPEEEERKPAAAVKEEFSE